MTKAKTAEPVPELPKEKTESPMVRTFRAARRCSTPLVGIETPDAAATYNTLMGVLPDKAPVLVWDIVRGLTDGNTLGKQWLKSSNLDPLMMVNLAEALMACERLPPESVLFLHNLHLQLRDGQGTANAPVVQALWNLRDLFKMDRRMAVGLGATFQLPLEIAGDYTLLDEPLPTRDELSATLDQQHKNAQLPLPTDEVRAAALDAMVGLPTFTAEQCTAIALTKDGLDIPMLWERKIKAIQNTEGLRVWRPRPGETTMAELKGIDNAVAFMEQMIDSDAFGAIAFLDEMDKAMAGGMSEHTGDSGVSKDQVGQVLSYIEDTGSPGVLLAGLAGTAKTQLVKAVGMKSGKPVIVFDLGGMKGGTVGQSERQIRAALKVLTATAEGRVLFTGTANRTTLFTPEMNRRFPDQFFFDAPTAEGRAAIWQVYIAKNGLTPSQAAIPAGHDLGWTGAEIKRACERAARWGCTVVEASRFIIPQSVSAEKEIAAARLAADGRFLSASYPGFYAPPGTERPVGNRTYDFDPNVN